MFNKQVTEIAVDSKGKKTPKKRIRKSTAFILSLLVAAGICTLGLWIYAHTAGMNAAAYRTQVVPLLEYAEQKGMTAMPEFQELMKQIEADGKTTAAEAVEIAQKIAEIENKQVLERISASTGREDTDIPNGQN